MASEWAQGRKMSVWLDPAATVQARISLEERLNVFHLKHTAGEEGRMYMEQRVACRASDSRSTGCGSTAERGRFALLTRLTQEAGVLSTGSRLPSAGLSLAENQMVKIAKPL